jgi:hypothetical protein
LILKNFHQLHVKHKIIPPTAQLMNRCYEHTLQIPNFG